MKKIILIAIILLSSNNLFPQSGKWIVVDSVQKYYAFRYGRIGYAGDKHYITFGNMNLRWPWNRVTSDGGSSWKTTLMDSFTVKPYYQPPMFADLAYTDTNLCITVCDSCYYWRSTDGCRSWKRGKIDCKITQYQAYLNRVNFYDNKFGGIITPIECYLTFDGGDSWSKLETNLPDSLKPTDFNDVFFPDSNIIIALVWNKSLVDYFIISEDRGKTWKAYDPVAEYSVENYRFRTIFFLDKFNGYACGGSQVNPPNSIISDVIWHTTDGGKTWEKQLDSLRPFSYNYGRTGLTERIQFCDKDNGIALGRFCDLWRTSDGGKHWIYDTTVSYKNFPNNFFIDAVMLSPKKILAVTYEAGMTYMYTEDDTTSITVPPPAGSKELCVSPNPSQSSININYTLERPSYVRLSLFDTFGREIAMIENGYKDTGKQNVQQSVEGLPAGVYFVMLRDGTGSRLCKVIIF